ncbi:ubiquitin hydrolase [Sarocladium strictum]
MNRQNYHHNEFYDAHVGARRQLHPSRVTDRLSEPTLVLTGILLLVAVLYNLWGSPTLDTAFSQLEAVVWNTVVTLTPRRLIRAIEWRRASPGSLPMEPAPLDTHAAKDEAMRRILGLGSTGGVMASAFQKRARALSMSSMLGLKPDPERPPGLGNRDNSCFQNSILQGLASLRTFPDYLAACVKSAESDDETSEVAQTLRTLISDLTNGVNNGRTIWTPNKLRFMSTWTQQDAQEYYSKILDDIDKGIAKTATANKPVAGFETESKDASRGSQHSDDSGYQSVAVSSRSQDLAAIRNPLEGMLAQRVACTQCGYSEGLSMIPFNCLTLSLGLDRGYHDLYERLDAYSKVEPIEGVECSKCTLLKAQRLLTKLVEQMRANSSTDGQLAEPLRRLQAVEEALEEDDFEDKTIAEKCKITAQSRVSTTKTKQVAIARPPRSLAIHMNRSVFDPSTFDMMKNSAPVSFPLTLDLGPWCLGSKGLGPNTVSSTQDDTVESWALDARASMVAGDIEASRLSGPIYELRAAVTHAGRHENGHYICYRRHARHKPSTGMANQASDEADMIWWRLSDHNVSRVEEETVLSLSPGVFMLFYDCVDPSMVVTDEDVPMQDAEATFGLDSTLDDEILPVATPELTGDDDDGAQTESEGPGTPRNPAEVDEEPSTVRSSAPIEDTAQDIPKLPHTGSTTQHGVA